jgi:urea transport system substrate-binding protein
LVGSDYIFPRTANLIIAQYLDKKRGLKIDTDKCERYTPLGWKDYDRPVREIADYKPDVVFSTINGDSNINFYKEMAARGLTADKCLICATNIGEDELRGLDRLDAFKGHLAAYNYFQSIDTFKNREYVKKVKEKYGKDHVTFDALEAAYMAVYFWKLAVEKAGSTEVDKVRAAFKEGIEFDAPGGKVKLDPKTQHTYKRFYMGKIRDDGQFDIVHKTNLIEPEPYPQEVFEGWHCDWTKNGVTRGKPIQIFNPARPRWWR